MSDVKRLLAEATPLPWYQTEEFIPADADLIVYAVNHLPAYEAAVDALERLIDETCSDNCSDVDCPWYEAREALLRLREDPA